MPFASKLLRLASSPQGRRAADKALRYAKSPEGRAKIAQLRDRATAASSRRGRGGPA